MKLSTTEIFELILGFSRDFWFLHFFFTFCSQMHHTMDGLEMLDPASSMTTLTPMSETPSITSPHHQLHGSYHGMNHMSYHHGGPLGGHTPGMNHYGKHFSCTCISELFLFHSFYIDPFQNSAHFTTNSLLEIFLLEKY